MVDFVRTFLFLSKMLGFPSIAICGCHHRCWLLLAWFWNSNFLHDITSVFTVYCFFCFSTIKGCEKTTSSGRDSGLLLTLLFARVFYFVFLSRVVVRKRHFLFNFYLLLLVCLFCLKKSNELPINGDVFEKVKKNVIMHIIHKIMHSRLHTTHRWAAIIRFTVLFIPHCVAVGGVKSSPLFLVPFLVLFLSLSLELKINALRMS